MSSNVHQLPPRKPTFFRELDVRHKQLYGVLCVRRFCIKYGISHEYIDALLQHLVKLLIADDLAKWEQEGAGLALPGRGDPLPSELEDQIDKQLRKDFYALIDSCVEIGITDMYGANTEDPNKHVAECIEILRRHNIEPPEREIYFNALKSGILRSGEPVSRDGIQWGQWWGKPVSPQIFDQLKALVWDN